MTTAAEPQQQAATANVVKVTVNLPEDLAVRLRAWAHEHGKTFTTALREAITLKLFVSEQLENNSKLLVEQEDGTVREIVFQ
jgi:predicted DNA-binding protein